jgi:molybdopterin biosynthesis enzyme MoaB
LSVQLETGAAAKGRNLAGSIVAKHLLLNNVTVLEMSLAVNPSVDDIRETVTRWCALLGSKGFILVVGGCGLGEHAVVPDALASMATKAAPMLGLMILRQAALESDCPESMATERTFAGSCSEGTFVSTLPCDSSGGTFPILNASIGVLLPLLPRILGVSERKL